MGRKLIIVLGPTAVGKTDSSIELALRYGSPVISCDSRQIYREMSIGTAVPSAAQLAAMRHYFIQTKSVTEYYTAGIYETEALELISRLFDEGHETLVMTGGSMFYIDAVCKGLGHVPTADLEIRRSLMERLEKEGLEPFREDLAQYWNYQEMRLITPSSSTSTIVKTACKVLKQIYRQGYRYKKAGVIVMGIGPGNAIQQDLFDINAEQFEKMRRLDAVIDRINKVNGSETIVLGSQQYTRKDGVGKADVFANAIKHDFRSKNPTTRWSDIITLK